MELNKIHTEKAPAAVGPYSQAVEVNGMLYTSGQIALDPATRNGSTCRKYYRRTGGTGNEKSCCHTEGSRNEAGECCKNPVLFDGYQ